MDLRLNIIDGSRSADLRQVYTEDGIDYEPSWIGFRIEIRTDKGGIYWHNKVFKTIEDCQVLKEKIEKKQSFNMKNWYFTRWEYGSEGWINYGEAEQISFERKQLLNR